jgi:hypothetical protein
VPCASRGLLQNSRKRRSDVVERGYPVRKWVSAWACRCTVCTSGSKVCSQATRADEAKSEILKLCAELRRTQEERDIPKKKAAAWAREPEQSTRSSMTLGAAGQWRPSAECCASPEAAFTLACTRRCRSVRSKINDCSASFERRMQRATACTARRAYFSTYARRVKAAANTVCHAS